MRPNLKEEHNEFLEIYFLNPTPFEMAGAAWPVRLGHNIAKPHYHIGPRISPYYYLIFVLEGEGTFIQHGRTYPLRPNDMYCLFPQVTHEYYTNPEKPLKKLFIAFDGKLALKLLERAGLYAHQPHRQGILTEEAISELWQLAEVVSKGETHHTDLERLSLFYRVFDRVSHLSDETDHAASYNSDWLVKGKEFLSIHYNDGITVDQVSQNVGVDRTHFSKQFRKAYGISPVQYIQYLKIKEATLLLFQTNYKISEIAQSVGYPDVFSFSRAFKKLQGMSPNRYRQGLADGAIAPPSIMDNPL
ncbi:helix-turn-helix transcriptional regulator [Paenibacillus protaetiae]|uniref:AraC family transcriptional regulator n=1 Tax=Paenibacillus protaetiae TaxID=2509456 RepID=A0A4P6EQW1_9BACL|nr:AraC family transcriptional regulator [Paenibacillus protaetiae]QAY65232.1 AraC family transcriptional regulator [Paenibacillus protaetiae]